MGHALASGSIPQEVLALTLSHGTVAEAVAASCCSSATLAARLAVRPAVALHLGNDDDLADTERWRRRRTEPGLQPGGFAAQAFSRALWAEVMVPLSMLGQALSPSHFRGLIPLRGLGELRVKGVVAPPGRLGVIASCCHSLRALTVTLADESDAEALLRVCARLRAGPPGELVALALSFLPFTRHPQRPEPAAVLLALSPRLPATVQTLYMNDLWPNRQEAWCSVQLPPHVRCFGSVVLEPAGWASFSEQLQPQPHVRVLAVLLVNPLTTLWGRCVEAAEVTRVLRQKFPRLEAVELCLQYIVELRLDDERKLSRPWMLNFLRRLRAGLAASGSGCPACSARIYSAQLNARTLALQGPLMRELCRLGYEVPAASDWDFAPPISFRRV